jgi:hypothetical protein
MALTYEQTYALTADPIFRGRVSVGLVHFADYITAEPASTPAHSTRYKWAQTTLVSPDIAVQQTINTIVNDAAVQQEGAAITDAALQGVVETAVNKLL